LLSYSVAKHAEVTYLASSSLLLLHGRGRPEHANNILSPAQEHYSNHQVTTKNKLGKIH
jgi:hypothetical protein